MSQENVEIVRAAFEAYLLGDEGAVLDVIAEDVTVKNPRGLLDVPAVRHGRDAWRDSVAEFEEVFGHMRVEVREWVDAGDWVLGLTRWMGKAKGSGVPVEANQVDAFRLRDGKVVEANLSYRSKEAALKALGLSEQDTHADS
jgi:ketosteroid isomerase-like protein